MRDTTDHNEKLKSNYDDFNESPKVVTHSDYSSVGSNDSSNFVSESNHATADELNSKDTSEFNTVAKPL
jgi:hypothetical protein